MRIELALDATADAAYDTSAHHKLRGRIWRGLEEVDEYAATHDTDYGVGFAFSNVFPWETSTKAIDAISESHHRGVTYWTHSSTTSVATEPSMSAKCGSR